MSFGAFNSKPYTKGGGNCSHPNKALCKHGQLNLNVNDCSLFIYKYNRAAVSAYKKLGFKVAANTPENHDLSPLPENCVHMVK